MTVRPTPASHFLPVDEGGPGDDSLVEQSGDSGGVTECMSPRAPATDDVAPEEVIEVAKQVRSENRLNRQTRKSGDQGRMTKKQRREWQKGLGSYRRSEG